MTRECSLLRTGDCVKMASCGVNDVLPPSRKACFSASFRLTKMASNSSSCTSTNSHFRQLSL